MTEMKYQSICESQKVSPQRPKEGSIVGIAIESVKNQIIHGLRHNIENGTNGWYIWGGEYSEDSEFFNPICFEHLESHLPKEILKFLDLPPGYRFLVDLENNHEDIWFDSTLLNT